MRAVKKINNNAVICRDGNDHELVAFGKGIGFPAMPYEITDLKMIQRTFYNISPQYLELVDAIPFEIIEFTGDAVDEAGDLLSYEMSPNLVLTLADHIAFAIKRKQQNIFVRMPLAYDMELTYPKEMKAARKILRKIWSRFRIRLPEDEASGIALAFVNAKVYEKQDSAVKQGAEDQKILDEITGIVEKSLQVHINRNTFNFARYATHIQYLLDRLHQGKGIDSINQDMYDMMRSEYEEAAACADRIGEYLRQSRGYEITEEEKLYLILHINRVCANEGL